MPNPLLDPARWAQLSSRLDELLEHQAAARAARLATLRSEDPRLAAELEQLLATVPAIRAEAFLEDDLPQAALGAGAVRAGSVCGAWMLERQLGTGGMGSVWLAQRSDGRYGAQAAVKLPHPAVLAQGGAERFEREGRLLARVSHPHIAGLLDAGVAASGQPYLVLEYVQGEAIDAYCDARGLGVALRISLFLDVLAAVAHAHGQLVLHRDLKPSNILVDGSGRVKLLDFGIAKLIESDPDLEAARGAAHTQRVFTPDHVAPEQLQGEPLSMATDVYALGVLLYQLLAGCHPTSLESQSPVTRLRAVVESVPAPMSEVAAKAPPEVCALRAVNARQLARLLRGDLDTIVAKALKKDPAERYAGAASFADDLRRWCAGHPVLARPDSPGHRLRLFVRRHRMGVGAAAASLVLLVTGAAATSWQAVVARRERDESRWQADRALARSQLYSLLLGQMGRPDAPLTQRQLLDTAVKLIESRFGSKPRLAVELLLPIAGQYHTMGDVQADLAVMQLAARMAAASGDAELVATTACSTVDTYIALDRLADAEAAVAKARAAVARIAEPAILVQASCWRYEAELAHEQGQHRRALEIASNGVRRMEVGGHTGTNLYTSLLSLLMLLQSDNGLPAAAFVTVQRLAEHHRAASGEQTLDAAMVESTRAMLLAEAGEIVGAYEVVQQVVARFGALGGGAPAPVLLALAQIELAGGRTVAAQATLVRAEAASRSQSTGEFDAAIAYLRALVALADGNATEARRSLDSVDSARGPRGLRFVSHSLGITRARLLLAESLPAAAVEAIEAELARLEAAEVAHLARRADAWRAAAEIHLAAGSLARAALHAEAALAASTRAARNAEASAHVGLARLLLARVRQAEGDAEGAREQARRAAGPLTLGLGTEHPQAMQARALGGPA